MSEDRAVPDPEREIAVSDTVVAPPLEAGAALEPSAAAKVGAAADEAGRAASDRSDTDSALGDRLGGPCNSDVPPDAAGAAGAKAGAAAGAGTGAAAEAGLRFSSRRIDAASVAAGAAATSLAASRILRCRVRTCGANSLKNQSALALLLTAEISPPMSPESTCEPDTDRCICGARAEPTAEACWLRSEAPPWEGEAAPPAAATAATPGRPEARETDAASWSREEEEDAEAGRGRPGSLKEWAG